MEINLAYSVRMKYDKTKLQTGLTLVRAGVVLTFLGALALAVPTLKISLLARVVQFLPLLCVAGQLLCLSAPEEVNKNWIFLSLGTVGFSYAIIYIPALALLISKGMVGVLGLLGLMLMGLVSVLTQLVAAAFLLLFFRGLALHYGSEEVAAQFLRLIWVPVGAVVLAFLCAKFIPSAGTVVALSFAVLGLALIVAFSGAVGRLSGLVNAAA